jgi:hypothetical protein
MLRKLSVSLVALLALGLSSTVMAGGTTAVCNDESVASLGGFNNEATCPSGSTATGGGYELVSKDFSQLLGASVNESMPVFTNITPTGWEVVGSNLTTIEGTIRVCVICAHTSSP